MRRIFLLCWLRCVVAATTPQFLERGLLRSANFTQPSDLCVMSLCEIACGRSGLLVRPVPYAKFVKQLGKSVFRRKRTQAQ